MTTPLTVTRLSGFGRGKVQEFSSGPVTLGTAPDADVLFEAAWDKTVSARHAVLDLRWDGWWIVDQSSAGSWIAGRRVTQQPLKPGDTIELGKGGPTIRIEWPASTPASTGVTPTTASPSPRRAPLPAVPDSPKFAPAPARASGAAEPHSIPATHASRPGGNHTALYFIIGVLALAVLGTLAWFLIFSKTATEDAQLAAAAQQLEPSIGLVVLVINTNDGPRTVPLATAWAVGSNAFATNAHVTQPVQEALDKGAGAFIITNRNPDLRYTITQAIAHPKFGKPLPGPDGKPPAVPAYDVGILVVKETVTHIAPMAPADELAKIDSGYRVATLGFPMEGLAGGGVDFRNPVATMQSGIITSATDYWLSQADFAHRLLLQHNLAATGGSSGSPLFNTKGQIVGVLSAGNIIGEVDFSTGQTTRAPSGVMINFAQRVDLLNDFFTPQ